MNGRYEQKKQYYPSDIARYDIPSRQRKGEKILQIILDFTGKNGLEPTHCLDIGCGPGIISDKIATQFSSTVGIDLDSNAIQFGNHNKISENLKLQLGNVEILPYADAMFDVVVCAQVYEHVSNPEKLVSEIWRVLKPGGICFFSGPNRLALIEEHYFLPLLSWFPHSISNIYVRLFGKNTFYDAYPWYFWQLRRLWQQFDCTDYTFEILHRPDDFGLTGMATHFTWTIYLPELLRRLVQIFIPNYNWILQKPNQ